MGSRYVFVDLKLKETRAVLILIGEAILFQLINLALFTVCFWAFFHFYIVLFEEPALRVKFGADYEKYEREVPRWMPKLRKR